MCKLGFSLLCFVICAQMQSLCWHVIIGVNDGESTAFIVNSNKNKGTTDNHMLSRLKWAKVIRAGWCVRALATTKRNVTRWFILISLWKCIIRWHVLTRERPVHTRTLFPVCVYWSYNFTSLLLMLIRTEQT